jgi:hypothetical protein
MKLMKLAAALKLKAIRLGAVALPIIGKFDPFGAVCPATEIP